MGRFKYQVGKFLIIKKREGYSKLRYYKKLITISFILSIVITIAYHFKGDILRIVDNRVDYFHISMVALILLITSIVSILVLLILSKTDIVKRLRGTSIMIKKAEILFASIYLYCVSILISLFFIFRLDTIFFKTLIIDVAGIKLGNSIYLNIINFLYALTLISAIIGFIYFIKFLNEILLLLTSLYNSYTPKISEKDIQLFKKRLYELEKESQVNNEDSQ